jgi:single-stranded-DNA-specific exonuclease
VAVVNPNRQDESGDLGHLCAAGVVFLLLVEANRRLKALGRQGPDLMAMLDLVALATVADVAPLMGVNRALVRQGLLVMARRERPGLAALADVAGLGSAPTCHHLGYVLGPRVNAGGRVGQADLGARLLATDDPAEAQTLAERLDHHNRERREIEAGVQASALAQAESRGDGPLAWAAGEGWHPGVVGIVAARLKESTGRPAVVIALDGEIGKGSARSVAGVDIGAAIHRLASEGLLLRGGGHRMAAGLTVERGKLGAAMERLGELLARQGAGAGGPRDLSLDGLLMPKAAHADLVDLIDRAGPFGAGAPSPRFAFPDLAVTMARTVGTGHLKLALTDGMGGRIDAIAFGAAEGPLRRLQPGAGRFHVAGRLEVNVWQGRRSAQLLLDDAAPALRR